MVDSEDSNGPEAVPLIVTNVTEVPLAPQVASINANLPEYDVDEIRDAPPPYSEAIPKWEYGGELDYLTHRYPLKINIFQKLVRKLKRFFGIGRV